MLKYSILLVFIAVIAANSQSLSVFEIDTTNFPIMSAKFYAFDKDNSFESFTFGFTPCGSSLYAVGGSYSGTLQESTLKLTHPNGGEKFLVGSDTLITWEGVLHDERIAIDYSTNNGLSWNNITYNGTNDKYIWKNIPLSSSEECLIKIYENSLKDKAPKVEWKRCYGGSYWERGYSVLQTNDGGYILAGSAESNDGDVSHNKGSADLWIIKIDNLGNIVWEKTYGGRKAESAKKIINTQSGGYLAVGWTDSNDGDVSGQDIREDYWVINLDADGNIIWESAFGGNSGDYAESVCQTWDG
jgi:hypothetical protein